MNRQRQKAVWSRGDLDDHLAERPEITELIRLMSGQLEPNPIRRLRRIEAKTKMLVRHLNELEAMTRHLARWALETEDTRPNSRLPWTQDEDGALVEWRTDGDSLDHISRQLGRTTQACATRLSQLTGVSRSDIIQAYITGSLDGNAVRGMFNGAVKRVSS